MSFCAPFENCLCHFFTSASFLCEPFFDSTLLFFLPLFFCPFHHLSSSFSSFFVHSSWISFCSFFVLFSSFFLSCISLFFLFFRHFSFFLVKSVCFIFCHVPSVSISFHKVSGFACLTLFVFFNFFTTIPFSPYFLYSLFRNSLSTKITPVQISRFFLISLILNLMFLVLFSSYFDSFLVSSPCVYLPDVHSLCPPSSFLLFFLCLALFSHQKMIISLFFFCKIFVFLFSRLFSFSFFFISLWNTFSCSSPFGFVFFSFGRFQSYPFEKYFFSPNKISFAHISQIVFFWISSWSSFFHFPFLILWTSEKMCFLILFVRNFFMTNGQKQKTQVFEDPFVGNLVCSFFFLYKKKHLFEKTLSISTCVEDRVRDRRLSWPLLRVETWLTWLKQSSLCAFGCHWSRPRDIRCIKPFLSFTFFFWTKVGFMFSYFLKKFFLWHFLLFTNCFFVF